MKFLLNMCVLLTFSVHLFSMDKALYEEPHTLLSKLSLRQKIAQLCIVAAISNEEKNEEALKQWHDWQPLYCLKTGYVKTLIQEHNVGGVIFYGKKTLPVEQQQLTQELQSISPIPLIIAMDAESGLANYFEKDTVIKYPCNMAVGATADPELVYAMGHEIGLQLSALGVTMNFAPVIDVNCNPNNPIIGARSFGSDPKLVSSMGIAFMRGLHDAGILSCAKHFPGHGDTHDDSHKKLPCITHSYQRLHEIELYPYRELIKAGVKSIMIAHLQVPALEDKKGLPSTLSRHIVTDLLEKEMQFDGLVITDALGMKAAADYVCPGELEVQALEAGVDVLLCPVDPVKAIDCIENAVKQGRLREEDIDKKVLKILLAKQWTYQNIHKNTADLDKILLSDGAKKLKRKLYEKAVTLVKPTYENFQLNNPDSLSIIAFSHEPTVLVSGKENYSYIRLPYNSRPDELKAVIESIETNHVLVSIHNPNCLKYSDHVVPDGVLAFITRLKERNKKVTVALFGSPYSVQYLTHADAIILGYDDDNVAQQVVLDIITGKQKAQGSMPVNKI